MFWNHMIWCQGAFYHWYLCNVFLQFSIPISWKEQLFSYCGYVVLCLSFLVWFFQNFIMLPLQWIESSNWRMETVLNVTKGFKNFSLCLCFLNISWYSILYEGRHKFTRNVCALKSYTPSKAADIFLKQLKKVWDMEPHRAFHQIKFIKHKWPLTKRIFVMLILFIKKEIVNLTK